MLHELKILPEYFDAVVNGEKKFEIRKNDRGFRCGDVLCLKEWDKSSKSYTGRKIMADVTYLLDGDGLIEYGLMDGFCIMSIDARTESDYIRGERRKSNALILTDPVSIDAVNSLLRRMNDSCYPCMWGNK